MAGLFRKKQACIAFLVILLSMPATQALSAGTISRRDGFLLLWQSIKRPSEPTREASFTDVREGERGEADITYAKARGILDDDEPTFRPDAPLTLDDALVWLLRTRSVDSPEEIMPDALFGALARYPIARWPEGRGQELSEPDLLALMHALDTRLASEEHEVSLYAEKFHGKGTASGEPFNMYAQTAAHKYFPFNTLVRVTNAANGKSVVVRINDRGPYVDGRDMDLSLASFLAISPRENGVIRATFQRLGNAFLVNSCSEAPPVQTRITRDVRLNPGVPQTLKLGGTLMLRSDVPFVVRSVRFPDGNALSVQDWVLPGEAYSILPSMTGEYTFTLGTREGRRREMSMRVVQCGE